jgi:hypothetical protein
VPTSTTACLTVEARDPENLELRVSGISITFTYSSTGELIFSGVTDKDGVVRFEVPTRPVYYDYLVTGYSDGSSCYGNHHSIAAPSYPSMWLQPTNPGGSGVCRYE